MLFFKNTIISKEWLDIIFAGRNKEYGAYQLRKYSNRATNIALLVVVTVIGGLCSLSFIVDEAVEGLNKIDANHEFTHDVTLDIEEGVFEEPIKEEKTFENDQPTQVAQAVSALDLVKFTEINPSSNFSNEDLAIISDALDKKVLLASINMNGKPGGEILTNGTFGKTKRDGKALGSRIGDPNGENIEDPFVSVEVMPRPPGGMQEFVKWVSSNYNFSESAIQNEANGLVQVTFVVEKDGSLSTFQVSKDIGFGSGDEAIRLLRKAEKWRPGIQNGVPVRVTYTLPIRLSTIVN